MKYTPFRIEHDSLGSFHVPSSAYYGCQTMRAVENFPITGRAIGQYPNFILALSQVKKAAAQANKALNILEEAKADAIIFACDSLIEGKYAKQLHEMFPVDVIQGGAGTSTNMNINEVVCNLALEYMGHNKGEYQYLHPNNDVNMSQSTNDVYPTALRIFLMYELKYFREALNHLGHSFAQKGKSFQDIIKMGRTQLQDAVPMTLGQEFSAWAETIEADKLRLREATKLMTQINLGATAIGTGINASPQYTKIVTENLRIITRIPLISSRDLIEATQDTGAFVQLSAVLKRIAIKLSKICNDLRLLSSGPRCGFGEINLPARAPGSSIMPGKVNPIIPEVLNQVAFTVIGNDTTITLAAASGQLELNVMEPVIAYSLVNSIQYMSNACIVLDKLCVQGITANEEKCKKMVENSIGIITAFVPRLGYELCAEIAKQAFDESRSVLSILQEKNLCTEEEFYRLIQPDNIC